MSFEIITYNANSSTVRIDIGSDPTNIGPGDRGTARDRNNSPVFSLEKSTTFVNATENDIDTTSYSPYNRETFTRQPLYVRPSCSALSLRYYCAFHVFFLSCPMLGLYVITLLNT